MKQRALGVIKAVILWTVLDLIAEQITKSSGFPLYILYGWAGFWSACISYNRGWFFLETRDDLA